MGRLSQFIDYPTDIDMQAAYRVLKYLKGCSAVGLLFLADNDLTLTGFSDADWATCAEFHRSITGHCFYLGKSLISWKSKKQSTVARSSSEAEYRVLALATCQAQWLSYIMKDIGLPITKPITLFCDNRFAIHIATNPIFHE
ncbi:secreted RxLR effector protein 161-like [Arachis stenosperma]|uniref:secreted RxLR effector protein 161-like n=1 Tax=Arachis stenosperma TaxID=217475 RepID=UPI0025ACD8A7|nr:secreted RxLR effector protein 161-like [Arachis stenosperma]